MRNFFAVTKCPASCSMIEKSRATMKMSQPSRSSSGRLSLSACRRAHGPRTRLAPCAGQLRAPGPVPSGPRRAHPPGSPRPGARLSCSETTCATVSTIPGERDAARPESLDAHLVGRVVDGRGGPAGACPPRGPAATAGNASSSSGWKVQVCARGPVDGRARRREPGPASPAPARSGSACPAGWPGRWSSRR